MSEEIPSEPPPGDALQQVLSMAANLPVLIEKIRPIINQNEEELKPARELEEWFRSVINVSGISGGFDIHSESFRTQFESNLGSLEEREKELEDSKKEVKELQLEVQKRNEKLRKLQQHCKRLSQEVMAILDCDDDEQPSTSQAFRISQTGVQDEVISSSKHSSPSPLNTQPNTVENLSDETANTNHNRTANGSLETMSSSNLGAEENRNAVTLVAMASTSKPQTDRPGPANQVNMVPIHSSITTELPLSVGNHNGNPATASSSRGGLGRACGDPAATEICSDSSITVQNTIAEAQSTKLFPSMVTSDITVAHPSSINSLLNTLDVVEAAENPPGSAVNTTPVVQTGTPMYAKTQGGQDSASTALGNIPQLDQTTSIRGNNRGVIQSSPPNASNSLVVQHYSTLASNAPELEITPTPVSTTPVSGPSYLSNNSKSKQKATPNRSNAMVFLTSAAAEGSRSLLPNPLTVIQRNLTPAVNATIELQNAPTSNQSTPTLVPIVLSGACQTHTTALNTSPKQENAPLSVSISPTMALNATSTVSSTVNPSTSNSLGPTTPSNPIRSNSSFAAVASSIYQNRTSNCQTSLEENSARSSSSPILPPMRLRLISNVTTPPIMSIGVSPEAPSGRPSPISSPARIPQAFSSGISNVGISVNNYYQRLRRDLTCNQGRCDDVKFPSLESLISHKKREHQCVARKADRRYGQGATCRDWPPPKWRVPTLKTQPRLRSSDPGPSSGLRIVRMPSGICSQTHKSAKSGKRNVSMSNMEQVIRSVSQRDQESSDEEQTPTLSQDDSVSAAKRKRVSFNLPDNPRGSTDVRRNSDEDRRDSANIQILKRCKVCQGIFPDDELQEHMKTHKKPSSKKGSTNKREEGKQ